MTDLLIIDDSDIDVFVFRESVRIHRSPFQCSSCQSGHIALKFIDDYVRARSCLPKVIVVDNTMPMMQGLEFIELLSVRFAGLMKEANVFLISVHIEPAVERRARLLGATGVLLKPVTLQMLRYLEAFT